ncbi:MAG: SDR family oxidoreductase [Myxococcota bacterium]
MSFLELDDKDVVVFGVSNKKSVGFRTHQVLVEAGARVHWVVRSEGRRDELARFLGPEGPATIEVCDVESPDAVDRVADKLPGRIHGVVHAIAFANYAEGMRPFEKTKREDFAQAMQISCHSLIEIAGALRPRLVDGASVVTISISHLKMAAQNYGYMAPVKAALESSVVFLAKSFSSSPSVRFNAVSPSLLKTRSAAGIPGYADSYLYAEHLTLRGKGVQVEEVANAVAFALSPRSSGINGQSLVVDAGMSVNYFDADVVGAALGGLE